MNSRVDKGVWIWWIRMVEMDLKHDDLILPKRRYDIREELNT